MLGRLKGIAKHLRSKVSPKSAEGLQVSWEKSLEHVLRANASQWEAAKRRAQDGPNILLASSVGGHAPVVALDSVLALALTMRGARVHFLLCDKFLRACEQCLVKDFPDQSEFVVSGPSKRLCDSCFGAGHRTYEQLGLPIHRYSHYVTDDVLGQAEDLSSRLTLEEIAGYSLDGMAVGEHAIAGALRYFSRGALDDEQHAEPTVRRYFHASLASAQAVRRLFETHDFQCASFHHGIYVPQGLVGEAARSRGVRVANWQVAYRKRCFIFSHEETYHHTLLREPSDTWMTIPWSEELESRTMDYLKSRWQGTRDWIWFHEKPEENIPEIFQQLGIDPSRPRIGMLTNVIWDAQLHYRTNAFRSMLDWVFQTVDYFAKRPDLQLIIRVHPAEIRGAIPSRQLVTEELKKAFPKLPPNVFLIEPQSQVSTYAVMEVCNAGIIYGTKTGVELTSMGIPVIVAGEAWIRNKGLTLDATSPEQYFELLNRLPFKDPLDADTVRRARMYAFHFFFRRMIPVECVKPIDGWPPFRLAFESLDDLLPGKNPGLDTICDGIMKGSPFVYPAECHPQDAY
jgi:hypothetical protein